MRFATCEVIRTPAEFIGPFIRCVDGYVQVFAHIRRSTIDHVFGLRSAAGADRDGIIEQLTGVLNPLIGAKYERGEYCLWPTRAPKYPLVTVLTSDLATLRRR